MALCNLSAIKISKNEGSFADNGIVVCNGDVMI
jgi:hypothetical protein